MDRNSSIPRENRVAAFPCNSILGLRPSLRDNSVKHTTCKAVRPSNKEFNTILPVDTAPQNICTPSFIRVYLIGLIHNMMTSLFSDFVFDSAQLNLVESSDLIPLIRKI